MPSEVTIPRLGWSMEDGIFVQWLKRDGETVRAGEPLFVLETEKATQEIESFDAGVLRIPINGPSPGDKVLVGQVIALLLADGESVGSAPEPAAAPPAAKGTSSAAASAKRPAGTASPDVATRSAAPVVAKAAPVAGPAARRMARRLSVNLQAITGSGPGGRITAGDIAQSAQPARAESGTSTAGNRTGKTNGETRSTPRARRAAQRLGVDVAELRGSGRGGRVRERDVVSGTAATTARDAAPSGTRSPASSIRRTIARRMVASHQATAPVTLTTRADATNLVSLRNQFKAAPVSPDDAVPSITDVVIKLVAVALGRHPELNARWEDEQVVTVPEIHVGFAVDSAAGLLVPVVRDVMGLRVAQIAARTRELVERGRRGLLTLAELQGGTFTISNLGVYGIDAFTPIINPPETAILGLGAIRREPVVVEGDRIVPRDQMTLSLTFDHRVVDGAPAARFLQTLRTGIENPAAWLTA